MKRKQMISFVLAGTLTTSSLSMYAQPVITELPQIEIQDDVQTTTSPAIEIAPEETVTEDKPTVLPLLPEDYEAEANKPVTLPMTPEDYEKINPVDLEKTQLEVNEEGYTVIQYNEGTLQKTIESLGIEFPEKLKVEGSKTLTLFDFIYLKENAIYLDLSNAILENNKLPDLAFSNLFSNENLLNMKLLEVILPSNLTSIGDFAFAGCVALKSIKIPDEVTSIGMNAFLICYSLQRVDLSQSLTSIGLGSFSECSSLEEIELPESLVSIGEEAFYKCTSLKSINIPRSVVDIGFNVFGEIDDENLNLTLKVRPYSIGEMYAKNANIPYEIIDDGKVLKIEKIEDIQLSIPYDYKDKQDLVVYPEIHANNGQIYSTPIVLDLSKINFEIQEAQQIKKFINLNQSNIFGLNKGEFVFNPFIVEMIINLEVMPKISSVGSIINVSNLEIETTINQPIVLPLTHKVELSTGEKLNLPIEWDETFYDMNKAGTYILDGEFILPEGIQNPENLKPQLTVKIIDPSSVTENPLEDFVIDEEGKLTAYLGDYSHIVIPEVVKVIGEEVFANNNKIETVVLPSSLEMIEDSAFKNANRLKKIVFNEGLKEIGDNAFLKCNELESIQLPNTLESIGANAFSNCLNLVGVDLGGNLTEINASAFKNCKLLEYVIGADNIEVIQDSSFENCILLNKINLENVKRIGNRSFYGSSIEELSFDKLESLGDAAFSHNGSLRKLDFKNSPLEIISDKAFFNCFNLVEINFPQQLKEIGQSAFELSFYTESIQPELFKINKDLILNFPDTLETINDKSFAFNFNVKEAIFNNDCSIGNNVFYEDLSKIQTSGNLTFGYNRYLSLDCLIINKNIDTLNLNLSKINEIIISNKLSQINLDFFKNANNVYIPPSINDIQLSLNPMDINTLFIVEENSYAHQFMEENDLNFILKNLTSEDFIIEDNILKKYVGEKSINKIIIPNGVKIIDENAFDSVSTNSLILPESVEIIKTNAFNEVGINHLVLGQNNKLILENGFLNNSRIKSLDLYLDNISYEKSLRLMEENLFIEELNLFTNQETLKTNILPFNSANVITLKIISNHLKKIDTNSLNLNAEKIIFNENLEVISDYPFNESNSVNEIVFPTTLKSLGVIPNLSNAIFYNDSSLTTLKTNTFKNNEMKNLILPNSIRSIESNAFIDGTLKTLYIPNSVVEIADDAFNGVVEGFTIIADPNSTAWQFAQEKGINCISEQDYQNKLFEIEDGVLLEYTGNEKIVYVPDGVHTIGEDAFSSAKVDEVYLPDSTTVIEDGAFWNSKVKKVVGRKVEEIKQKAFLNTRELKEFVGNSLREIDFQAFCVSNIEEIDLSNVGYIGYQAFEGSRIKNVKTGKNLYSIQEGAFENCSNLETVDLEDSIQITALFNRTFAATEKLNSVKLPKYLMGLTGDVFIDSGLERIRIPKSLRFIFFKPTVDAGIGFESNKLIYEIDSNHSYLGYFKGLYDEGRILLEIIDELEVIDIEKYPMMNILNGTDKESLVLPETVRYYLNNGKAVDLSILEWDLSEVDTSQKGSYIVKGKTNLNEILQEQPDNETLRIIQSQNKFEPLLKINVISNTTEKPDVPDEPNKPTTPSKPITPVEPSSPDTSKPVEKPLEVIRPAIHKVPLTKLEPAMVSSPLIPLNPAQTEKEELPVITPPQEEKPLERPIEKPIDKPQDEDTNTQQKVDSTNNSVDKNTSNKQPTKNNTSISNSIIQEWVEIEPSLPIQTLEDTQFEQKEDVVVPQVPISEEVIVNEDGDQPTNSFYEQFKKLFPNMSYNTFMILSTSIGFILVAAIFILVIYINKKRKEKENE